ncbi:MAG: Ig-like domain-containing protein [Bacteroidales bacterium]
MAPTGGDKDTIPPVVTSSSPPNYSTEFESQVIDIGFDEFIQLQDVNQKLIVSPPMKQKPDVQIRGKGIRIKIYDELLPNTTYTLNFNDAIVDNNEGNPLEDFEYVFSTGPELDSLQIRGILINALTLQPEEGAYAMLYENLGDSAPYLQVPYYVGKTNEEGEFTIGHIRSDTFRLFAMKDMNMNYMYDQANEAIGFLDSLIMLPFNRMQPDTIASDTGEIAGAGLPAPAFKLKMFIEEGKTQQYISSTSRDIKNRMMIVFGVPLDSTPRFGEIPEYGPSGDFLTEWNPRKDTLLLWIRDSLLMNSEVINLPLEYPAADSTGKGIWVTDTLIFRHVIPQRPARGERPEETSGMPEFILTPVTKNKSQLDLNRPVVLEGNFPVTATDTSRISLKMEIDSILQDVPYSLTRDSMRSRRFLVTAAWEPETKYRLNILPGAFTGYLGNSHDTLKLEYTTRKADYYGNLYLNVTGVEGKVIVQMLGSSEEVLQEKAIVSDTYLEFEYLHPGKVIFRAIDDRNGNGKWDTGHYLQKIQPERVHYYREEVSVRANWDIELNWDIDFEVETVPAQAAR